MSVTTEAARAFWNQRNTDDQMQKVRRHERERLLRIIAEAKLSSVSDQVAQRVKREISEAIAASVVPAADQVEIAKTVFGKRK
jgi:RNA 3'-terminal phosphate cyclase